MPRLKWGDYGKEDVEVVAKQLESVVEQIRGVSLNMEVSGMEKLRVSNDADREDGVKKIQNFASALTKAFNIAFSQKTRPGQKNRPKKKSE